MLHNPNWNKTINDVSLDDFIAWLGTKDPNETYHYLNKCGMCCIGQYMADRGIEWPENNWSTPYKDTCTLVFGDWRFIQHYLYDGLPTDPTAFGATLEKVKAFKEKQDAA